VQLSAELEASLREFAAAGPAELRENGTRVAPLSTLSWEVRGNGEKPLLHLWSENHNLTRRVLAITDHSETRLALAVECFGRAKPDRLEFLRIEFDRPERSFRAKPSRKRWAGFVSTNFRMKRLRRSLPLLTWNIRCPAITYAAFCGVEGKRGQYSRCLITKPAKTPHAA
jgi:hypothetical protein